MYYGVDEYGNHQQENPLDIDQAGFRPDAYMEKVLKECSLNELYKQEGRMKKGGGEGGGEREKSESGGREGCIHSCAYDISGELLWCSLSSEIQELDSNMQYLVYENHSKFIKASETQPSH